MQLSDLNPFGHSDSWTWVTLKIIFFSKLHFLSKAFIADYHKTQVSADVLYRKRCSYYTVVMNMMLTDTFETVGQ